MKFRKMAKRTKINRFEWKNFEDIPIGTDFDALGSFWRKIDSGSAILHRKKMWTKKKVRSFLPTERVAPKRGSEFVAHLNKISHGEDVPVKIGADRWLVVSTDLSSVSLIVFSPMSNSWGFVEDPDEDEWRKAFFAPSDPYLWEQLDRIVKADAEETADLIESFAELPDFYF